jgi:hypothetical protein
MGAWSVCVAPSYLFPNYPYPGAEGIMAPGSIK